MKFNPGKEIDYIDDMIIIQERQNKQKDINIKYNQEEEKNSFNIEKNGAIREKKNLYIKRVSKFIIVII